jgi:squalene-hopene/tetraprenyl-beta-curcumene cyclase
VAATAAQIERAIDLAADFLLRQAQSEFSGARHEMTFPHAAGFSGSTERQLSDVFARSTLGSLIYDIAESDTLNSASPEFFRIARREADYIAGRKLQRCHGGWSYFPDLPELPPDADSLAAALLLFARAAPEYVELCRAPIELVLAGARPDGSFETWVIAPNDPKPIRERMEWGVRWCWGVGADVDVIANFYGALDAADYAGYAAAVQRGARMLQGAQPENGLWEATWYVGPAYATGLCLDVLRAAGLADGALRRACEALLVAQRSDGSWGAPQPSPLETALSMWALRWTDDPAAAAAVERGAAALADMQSPDGSWFESPWIRMPIGRAAGHVTRVATYGSVAITTAFCLRTLAAGRRWGQS